MHRKFQLHTKKAELFNIIWKLHPSCDSATLQQYPWASWGLVQFPGNLCVPWCLAWEKSHHKHQRGSVLALGLWPGCLRTFQPFFHTQRPASCSPGEHHSAKGAAEQSQSSSPGTRWAEGSSLELGLSRRVKALPGSGAEGMARQQRAWLVEGLSHHGSQRWQGGPTKLL